MYHSVDIPRKELEILEKKLNSLRLTLQEEVLYAYRMN